MVQNAVKDIAVLEEKVEHLEEGLKELRDGQTRMLDKLDGLSLKVYIAIGGSTGAAGAGGHYLISSLLGG